jgi:regulator of protease activity HflC (stomatin/prohibitin superfamily)
MAQEEINMKKITPIIIIVAAVILIIIFWSRMTVTIDAGHAGLLYKTFGHGINKEQTPLRQGFHLLAPWNHVVDYEIRQKETTQQMEVLSSNLLKINMDITVLHQPMISKLGYLEVERGRSYETVIIMPVMRAVIRTIIAKYLPEEINTTKKEQIIKEIFDETKKTLENNYIQVNDILIRNIVLPQTLQNAIERKLKQEQESLEYEYKLQKAQKEAERQKIEAQGKAAANRIISASLTDKILTEKGIEATLKLSESPNTKIVVVGNSKNGMPLILGGNN